MLRSNSSGPSGARGKVILKKYGKNRRLYDTSASRYVNLEEVAAFIIRRSGATVLEGDIQDFCRGKIARHKIPKYMAFVDAFPLTASGKIQKYKLREDAAKRWPESCNSADTRA